MSGDVYMLQFCSPTLDSAIFIHFLERSPLLHGQRCEGTELGFSGTCRAEPHAALDAMNSTGISNHSSSFCKQVFQRSVPFLCDGHIPRYFAHVSGLRFPVDSLAVVSGSLELSAHTHLHIPTCIWHAVLSVAGGSRRKQA